MVCWTIWKQLAGFVEENFGFTGQTGWFAETRHHRLFSNAYI